MPLTAQLVKNAKPKAKRYKLYDSKGLYLSVEASGSKYWRMKYRFGGKENTSSFGTYPEITLKNARNQAQEARSFSIPLRGPYFSINIHLSLCSYKIQTNLLWTLY